MKFLADAHISMEMVSMIRSLGFDCKDSSAIPARMPDVDVLRGAHQEHRIVLTADKDFGELVFAHQLDCLGVILIRINRANESERVARLRTVWSSVVSRLPGAFVTVTAHSVRVRPLG